MSTVDRDYGIDLRSNGSEWLGTFGALVRALVADILVDGPYGHAEVTLFDDEGVRTGALNAGPTEGTFTIDGVEIDSNDVQRFRI